MTKTKTFQTSEYGVFTETCAALGKSESELCEALGYNPATWSGWKTSGKIPRVAAIACEGVRRRAGIGEKTFVLKTQTKPQRDALEAMARGLGIEIIEIQ